MYGDEATWWFREGGEGDRMRGRTATSLVGSRQSKRVCGHSLQLPTHVGQTISLVDWVESITLCRIQIRHYHRTKDIKCT